MLSKQLIKKAGATIDPKRKTVYALSNPTAPSLDEIKEAYPPTQDPQEEATHHHHATQSYIEYQCGDVKIHHYSYQGTSWSKARQTCEIGGKSVAKSDGKYYHEWRGESLLVSDRLLPLDVLQEINRAKDEELERSKKNRLQKIETPIDAVRLMLVELGLKPSMQEGSLRVYVLGACHIQFVVQEPYDVLVRFGFYNGGQGGPSHKDIDKLNLADPEFNDKMTRIMKNASEIINFIKGDKTNTSLQAQ